jgi:beta-glucanase (GH16 family)
MVSFALHTKEKNGSKGNNWSSRTYMDGIEGTFHTYGIEWQEEAYSGRDKISFTIDGVEYASSMEDVSTMDDNFYWPFNKEHFLILNLAMGGNMGGSIDDTIFQNSVIMKVDWVRVYQRTEKE